MKTKKQKKVEPINSTTDLSNKSRINSIDEFISSFEGKSEKNQTFFLSCFCLFHLPYFSILFYSVVFFFFLSYLISFLSSFYLCAFSFYSLHSSFISFAFLFSFILFLAIFLSFFVFFFSFFIFHLPFLSFLLRMYESNVFTRFTRAEQDMHCFVCVSQMHFSLIL